MHFRDVRTLESRIILSLSLLKKLCSHLNSALALKMYNPGSYASFLSKLEQCNGCYLKSTKTTVLTIKQAFQQSQSSPESSPHPSIQLLRKKRSSSGFFSTQQQIKGHIAIHYTSLYQLLVFTNVFATNRRLR